jgi:hypothetical protein
VFYYTADGKPDKKRRPGRPWDASIYAGGEKATYSGGSGVNLMAHIQREKIKRAVGSEYKQGSLKSVDQTLQEVSLQTYLEEVNLYEQLLNPITKIMEKTMGLNALGIPNLAERGFGEEGAKVVPALMDIGAIPPPALPKRAKKKVTIVEDASRRAGTAASTGTAEGNRVVLYNDSRKVTAGGIAMSRQSSFNSTYSEGTSGDGNITARSADVPIEAAASTPYEVLQATKQRKKLARKSYLPALDAFISSYEPKKVEEPVGGPMKSFSRLFEEDAAGAVHTKSVGGETRTRRGSVFARADASEENDFPPLRRVSQLAPLSGASVAPSTRQSVAPSVSSYSGVTSAMGAARVRSPVQQRVPALSQAKSSAAAVVVQGGALAEQEDEYWTDITRAAREEAEARRLEVVEKRRAKKKSLVRSSTIPWELLDQIDGAKHRFENEKLYHEFNHKY